MPATVSSLAVLQQYVKGVMDRADHHAKEVEEIALAVAGAIVWRTDGDLTVRTENGEMKNVLWLTVGGNRYAIRYDHEHKWIEVREKTIRGEQLATFNNDTPLREVKEFFAGI